MLCNIIIKFNIKIIICILVIFFIFLPFLISIFIGKTRKKCKQKPFTFLTTVQQIYSTINKIIENHIKQSHSKQHYFIKNSKTPQIQSQNTQTNPKTRTNPKTPPKNFHPATERPRLAAALRQHFRLSTSNFRTIQKRKQNSHKVRSNRTYPSSEGPFPGR